MLLTHEIADAIGGAVDRFVRIVPAHFFFEAAGFFVVLGPPDIRPDDAFEGVEHGAGAEALRRAGPVRARPQVDRVVVAIREPESKQDAARGLDAERVDELLAHQPHRRGAEDHDALLVQADDALIRAKIEQFREMQAGARRLVVAA